MQNALIKKAEAAIDEKVPPADKEAYERIVLAGMKVMVSKGINQQLMQALEESQDPIALVADGVIGILGILYKESRNTMPVVPMIFAGQSLLMEALDFMEQAGLIEIDPDTLALVTQQYIETFMPKLGITPEKMDELFAQEQAVLNDPQVMAEYKKQLGG